MKSVIYCIFVNISSQNDLFLHKECKTYNNKVKDAIIGYFKETEICERINSPLRDSVKDERASTYSSLLALSYTLFGVMRKISFLDGKPKFSSEIILGDNGIIPSFNISHSAGLGLICISDKDIPLGCDIESVMSDDTAEKLYRRFISKREEQIPVAAPFPFLMEEDLSKSATDSSSTVSSCSDNCPPDSDNFCIVSCFFDCSTGDFITLSPDNCGSPLPCPKDNTDAGKNELSADNTYNREIELSTGLEFMRDGAFSKEENYRFDVLRKWCSLESALKCIGGGFGSLCDLPEKRADIESYGSYLHFCGKDYYASLSYIKNSGHT